MASFMRWYGKRLAQQPIITQSITTAALFTTSDVLAQQLVEKQGSANHDVGRTARMAFYGGAIFGPCASMWFNLLQRRISVPKHPNLEILGRVAADQCVFAGANLGVFLSTMAVMEGGSAHNKLQSTYWRALQRSWMVWPATQAVNFKFVPPQYRLLFVNTISIGWNCYLSTLNGTVRNDEDKDPTTPPNLHLTDGKESRLRT